jgi:putative membrane protein
MRHLNTLRFYILFLCIVGVFFVIAKCTMSEFDEAESYRKVDESNQNIVDSNSKEADAHFLKAAAEINLEEILFAQLAQQKSYLKEVLDLANMLEDEHSKFQFELVKLALKKSITLPSGPSENSKTVYNGLYDKIGLAFDLEYCSQMIKSHEHAIFVFENGAKESSDLEIINWSEASVITFRKHLEQIFVCQQICKNHKVAEL